MATTQGPIGEVFLGVAVTPTTTQGPAGETLLQSSVTPVTTRGPVGEVEALPIPPPQGFGGPTGGYISIVPVEGFSGPVVGKTLLPPPQGFGGPTGDHLAGLAPEQWFSGAVSNDALLAPLWVFSGPTESHVVVTSVGVGFGAATGGVVTGIPAPINLTATVIDAGCIRLDWIDPSDEETGYRLERSLADADDWDVIATLPENTETFLDRFAVPLVVYDYRVIGFDPVRQSTPSNIATAVTPLPPDIATGPPPTSPQDPERNRLEPKPFSFDSPGVYGLEKDENGDVTGFKY